MTTLTAREVNAIAKDYQAWKSRRLTPEQVGIQAADVKDPDYNWRQNVVEYFPVPGRDGLSEPYVFATLPVLWNFYLSDIEVEELLQKRENELAAQKGRLPRVLMRCTRVDRFHPDGLTEVWFHH